MIRVTTSEGAVIRFEQQDDGRVKVQIRLTGPPDPTWAEAILRDPQWGRVLDLLRREAKLIEVLGPAAAAEQDGVLWSR